MIKINLIQKNRGFTLVETLVAISILMISVVGPMVFVSNGLKASAYARDQITAFYLAQDAVEALRFLRDNDRIAIVNNGGATSWDTFNNALNNGSGIGCAEIPGGGNIDGKFDDNEGCGIDTMKIYESPSDLSSGIEAGKKDTLLRINQQGYYNYLSGDDTRFGRKFTYRLLNNNEVEIIVKIDWSSGVNQRNFVIKENLFYWGAN